MNADIGPLELYTARRRETAAIVIRRYSTSFGARVAPARAGRALPGREHLRARAGRRRDRRRRRRGGRARPSRRRRGRSTSSSTRPSAPCDGATAPTSSCTPSPAPHGPPASAPSSPPRSSPRCARTSRATEHDAELRRYVYGSAEVVGLMCLRVFLRGHRRATPTNAPLSRPAPGASAPPSRRSTSCATSPPTSTSLGRSYFPGIDVDALTEAEKNACSTTSTPTCAVAAAVLAAAARELAAGARRRSRTGCSPSCPDACGRTPRIRAARPRACGCPIPVKLRHRACARRPRGRR